MTAARVSWLVVAFRQEKFIEEAVRSALAQTLPLDIVVMDDASPDKTFERAQDVVAHYRGPHRIRCFRAERNQGLAGNINAGMAQLSGDIVIIAAGDDVSEPHRAERTVACFQDARTLLVHSDAQIVDESGNKVSTLVPAAATQRPDVNHLIHLAGSGILGATAAWRRELFDVFGPIPSDVIFEDMVIPFRAALMGNIDYVAEPLVRYRRHSANMHFKHPSAVEGVAALLRDLERDASARLASWRARVADVEKWRAERPGVLGTQAVKDQVLRQLKQAQAELELFRHPSRRVDVLARAYREGVPFRRWVRWVMTCYFPGWLWRYRKWSASSP